MVALWWGHCHYVKRVDLDRVNHSKARGEAQLCAVRVSFCLGEKSEFISYSLVSISRPQPIALCLSHDWHTQCDSPELGEGMQFLLWIHSGILHFLSIKARLVDIHLMYPWWKKKEKWKKYALLCERLMLSQHLGRSKMGFVFRVVHGDGKFTVLQLVASSLLWNCIS